MLTVYLTLIFCTALPVIALHAGLDTAWLLWLVFGLVIVKALLLVDHFMEMKHAPPGWRLAAQGWTPAIVMVIALFFQQTG